MTDRLHRAFEAIDAANAADPHHQDGEPVELLYGRRMTEELHGLYPDASEPLQIACRGQHIERWTLPRAEFPAGRAGYLAWRSEQARRHAERVGAIMRAVGYGDGDAARAETMIRKQGIKRDPEVQALEDVACFTFMRHYMGPFSQTQSAEDMERIVNRTARKMSAMARARALDEFAIPEPLAAYFRPETEDLTAR